MKPKGSKPVRRYLLVTDADGTCFIRGPFQSDAGRLRAAREYPQYIGSLFELDVPLPADPRDARPRVQPLTGDEEGWSRG